MAMAKTLSTWLDNEGIHYELASHPRTYSSRDSADAAHVREDHMAKAVILKDGQGFLMAIIPADQWIKLHAINETLNRDLEMAAEAEIDTLFWDCQAGAIPPVGQAYGLETVLDESLTTLANVYLEVGDHEQLVHLSGDDFRHLMRGIRQGHFGHSH
jgi:Ala-tRNA(Pro) deacylase